VKKATDKKSVTTSMQQMAKVLMEAKKINNRAPSFVVGRDFAAKTATEVAANKTKSSRNNQTKDSLTGTLIGDIGEENSPINRPSALNFTGKPGCGLHIKSIDKKKPTDQGKSEKPARQESPVKLLMKDEQSMLQPLLDQEKHFFELTKSLMQPCVGAGAANHKGNELPHPNEVVLSQTARVAAYQAFSDIVRGSSGMAESLESIFRQTCKLEIILQHVLKTMLENA